MWKNNRIIFNHKDSSSGSIFCIYIRLQRQVYILHENYWKHWKLHLTFGQSYKTKVDTSFIQWFPNIRRTEKLDSTSMWIRRCRHYQSYRNCERIIRKLVRINQVIKKPYYTSRTELHSIRGRNKKIRSKIQKKRIKKQQRTLISLRDKMTYMEITLNNIAQEQRSSSWLTVLPIK